MCNLQSEFRPIKRERWVPHRVQRRQKEGQAIAINVMGPWVIWTCEGMGVLGHNKGRLGLGLLIRLPKVETKTKGINGFRQLLASSRFPFGHPAVTAQGSKGEYHWCKTQGMDPLGHHEATIRHLENHDFGNRRTRFSLLLHRVPYRLSVWPRCWWIAAMIHWLENVGRDMLYVCAA